MRKVKTFKKVCFSCEDQMCFQLYGQTPEYNPGKMAESYLKDYIKKKKPVITCELCSRRVRYVLYDDKWLETEEPETPLTPTEWGTK